MKYVKYVVVVVLASLFMSPVSGQQHKSAAKNESESVAKSANAVTKEEGPETKNAEKKGAKYMPVPVAPFKKKPRNWK